MKLGGSNTITSNITLTPTTMKFSGASPTEIGYLSGVTSAIQTQLNTCAKLAGAAFTGAITVNGNTPLYSLPTTANFTTLTVGNNAVATQAWVTGNAYLTSLPSTANFTTLTIGSNDVATQAWVTGNAYLTSLPSTAS